MQDSDTPRASVKVGSEGGRTRGLKPILVALLLIFVIGGAVVLVRSIDPSGSAPVVDGVTAGDIKGKSKPKPKPKPEAKPQTSVPAVQSVSQVPTADLGAAASEIVGADQTFRSSKDGFSFANYGGAPTNDSIDATIMAALFGKAAVCADKNASSCVMIPGAQDVANQLNDALSNGRCEGMSVLSQRFFDGTDVRPSGAAQTAGLSQPLVAKQLAYWWATQVAPTVASTASNYRKMPPSQIVAELIKGLNTKQGFTIGLYSAAGGHSVSPIAVTKDGSKNNIYIYDNNYPNEIRKIVVDPATESWTYGGAGTNSSNTGNVWSGVGAGTLDLTPMSARNGPFNVSFGATKGLKGSAYMVIATQEGQSSGAVGAKIAIGSSVVDTTNFQSVQNATYPVHNFVGGIAAQGAIAFVPVFTDRKTIISPVGGSNNGNFQISVNRQGSGAVQVTSKAKFELAIESTSLGNTYQSKVLNSADSQEFHMYNGPLGVEIKSGPGQSIEVHIQNTFGDNIPGAGRVIESSAFTYDIYSSNGTSIFTGTVDKTLHAGQSMTTVLTYDEKSNVFQQNEVITKPEKIDAGFIQSIEAPQRSSVKTETTTEPILMTEEPILMTAEPILTTEEPTKSSATTTTVSSTKDTTTTTTAPTTTTTAPTTTTTAPTTTTSPTTATTTTSPTTATTTTTAPTTTTTTATTRTTSPTTTTTATTRTTSPTTATTISPTVGG
jgi:hypothetical protein